MSQAQGKAGQNAVGGAPRRMAARNQTIRSHTTPKFLLDGFVSNADGSALWCHSLVRGNTFESKPAKVCRRTNYYASYDADGSVRQETESFFQGIETATAPAIRRVLQAMSGVMAGGRFVGITKEDRIRIANFVVWQLNRSPRTIEKMRRALAADFAAIQQKFHKRMASDEAERQLKLGVQNGIMQIMRGVDIQSNALAILEKNWHIVAGAGQEQRFISSDNPVVRFNPSGGLDGFGVDDAEVRFPLHSRFCLVIQGAGRRIVPHVLSSADFFDQTNELVGLRAHDFLFGSDRDEVLRVAEKALANR